MTRTSRYLVSRLLFVTVLLSLLYGVVLFFVEMITFDATLVRDWAKKSWCFLGALCQLPFILGVSFVFAMFYVTGFSLRESGYLKGAGSISCAELFPSYMGLTLFITIVILIFTVFIRPEAATSRQTLMYKMDKMKEEGKKEGDRKMLQKGVSLYYKGRYLQSWKLLGEYLKQSPHNRFARIFRTYAARELNRVRASAPDRKVKSRLFQDGLAHYQGGRFYKAISSFRRLLKAQPKHGPARRYLLLAEYALKTGGQGAVKDAEAALKVGIADVLRRGIDAYDAKEYWNSWSVMRDVLSLDPFNETAKAYLRRSRRGIERFDFFPTEERGLHFYPARQAVFLPFGKQRYLYAAWFIRRRTAFYLQRAWVLEFAEDGGLERALSARIGKWVSGKLVLRGVIVYAPRGEGLPVGKKILRVSVPSTVSPGRLWDASGLLSGESFLDPVAIINLVPYFSSSHFPLLRLKLAFTEVFALPVAVFCLALLVAAQAWQTRYTGVSLAKGPQVLLFIFVPLFVYFVLRTAVRFLMAVTRLGVSISPFFSYFNPVVIALLMLLAASSVFYRTARDLR